jgi:hypothetical protein
MVAEATRDSGWRLSRCSPFTTTRSRTSALARLFQIPDPRVRAKGKRFDTDGIGDR